MIDITPNPIAFSLGPIQVHWYGLAYVAAIAAGYWLATYLARQRGERLDVIPNGLILIAVSALIGGRLYHVIDQWAYYSSSLDHFEQIFLPPYSGLGIYGGLFTGLVAVLWYVRRHKLNFWRWADIIAPCILLAQAVGRWGNFANQELYGPPTNLPWGIAIQCQYRVPEYACPVNGGTTAVDAHFHPLFFYESALSLIGVFVLIWVWRRFIHRGLIAGDVGMLYFVWYGLERSVLEVFRHGYNWMYFGIPTAQLVGTGAAATAVAVILVRHAIARRRGGADAQESGADPDAGAGPEGEPGEGQRAPRGGLDPGIPEPGGQPGG